MRRLAADEAAVFGFDPCDPIHPQRSSDTPRVVDKGQSGAQLAAMTTKPFPARSPTEKVGGLVYFGRMLDKIRAHAKGELPPEYVEKLGSGFDGRCVRFLGYELRGRRPTRK